MKKVFFLLLIVLCFGVRMPNVQAKTARDSVSHGNLIYEGRRGGASLYAADIHLLEEKISTIPERCFDPVCYAHTHNWEYCRINERTHTRHCADCGDANDLTSPHRAESWERDTIIYKGKAYPGKRFTCACGYQWSMEMSHTMIYEAVDEVNHRSRCVLDGTPYCRGCELSVEEHYAWHYEMSEDGSHYEKICSDCGLRMEEEFETPEEPETGDPPEIPEEPGSEESPGTGDAPEESENEEEPGTEEAPEESGNEEAPGTEKAPEESGNEESPGTEEVPEESGNEEPTETGEVPKGMIYELII